MAAGAAQPWAADQAIQSAVTSSNSPGTGAGGRVEAGSEAHSDRYAEADQAAPRPAMGLSPGG